MTTNTTKICTKCGIEKPITEFRFRKSINKYYNQCAQCQNEDNKKYHETHKEEQKQRCKAYYEQNKEQQKTYKKAFYELNKEKEKEYRKEYYKKNRDYFKEKSMQYYWNNREHYKVTKKAFYELNKEKEKEYRKEYYKKNRDYLRKIHQVYRNEHKDELKLKKKKYLQTPRGRLNHLIACQKRRIQKQNNIYDPDADKYLEYLISKPIKICFICGKKIKKNEAYTIEHIIPISREGPHIAENLGLAHKSCNSSKNNRLTNEYIEYKLSVDGVAQTKIL